MIRVPLLLAALCHPLLAAVWYMDNSASGANNGTSLTDAWQDESNIVWGSISAGDVLYVRYGTGSTYGAMTVGASGSAAGNQATAIERVWIIGYPGDPKPVFGAITDGGNSSVGLVGLDIDGTSKTGTGILIDGGLSDWLIQDCKIQRWALPVDIEKDDTSDNSYCVLRGIEFTDNRSEEGTGEYQVLIGGNNHLVEYCTYEHGGDYINHSCRLSVFRNFYIAPMSDSDLDGIDPHIDIIQFFDFPSSLPLWSDKIVVEGVFSRETTTGNHHFVQIRDQNLTGNYGGLICRLNVIYEMYNPGENQNIDNERWYNNTIYRATAGPSTTGRWLRGTNVTAADNIYRNNSWSRVNNDASNALVLRQDSSSAISVYNNHWYLSDELTDPIVGSGNVEAAPGFVGTDPDGSLNDFLVPDVGSALLSAQSPMTEASGSATDSTSLTVDDADYFMDGFGIVKGDVIKIGSGDWVEITEINYSTEVITLEETRTWSDNDDVYLYGTEVIGARQDDLEYESLSGILNLGTTNSVAVTGEARFVQFYEDGVPQSPDYDAPYEYTDGGGDVTAKVYALFAAEIPVVEATLPVSSGTLTTEVLNVGP